MNNLELLRLLYSGVNKYERSVRSVHLEDSFVSALLLCSVTAGHLCTRLDQCTVLHPALSKVCRSNQEVVVYNVRALGLSCGDSDSIRL